MALQVKGPATRPSHLNSVPETRVMEGENRLPAVPQHRKKRDLRPAAHTRESRGKHHLGICRERPSYAIKLILPPQGNIHCGQVEFILGMMTVLIYLHLDDLLLFKPICNRFRNKLIFSHRHTHDFYANQVPFLIKLPEKQGWIPSEHNKRIHLKPT